MVVSIVISLPSFYLNILLQHGTLCLSVTAPKDTWTKQTFFLLRIINARLMYSNRFSFDILFYLNISIVKSKCKNYTAITQPGRLNSRRRLSLSRVVRRKRSENEALRSAHDEPTNNVRIVYTCMHMKLPRCRSRDHSLFFHWVEYWALRGALKKYERGLSTVGENDSHFIKFMTKLSPGFSSGRLVILQKSNDTQSRRILHFWGLYLASILSMIHENNRYETHKTVPDCSMSI